VTEKICVNYEDIKKEIRDEMEEIKEETGLSISKQIVARVNGYRIERGG